MGDFMGTRGIAKIRKIRKTPKKPPEPLRDNNAAIALIVRRMLAERAVLSPTSVARELARAGVRGIGFRDVEGFLAKRAEEQKTVERIPSPMVPVNGTEGAARKAHPKKALPAESSHKNRAPAESTNKPATEAKRPEKPRGTADGKNDGAGRNGKPPGPKKSQPSRGNKVYHKNIRKLAETLSRRFPGDSRRVIEGRVGAIANSIGVPPKQIQIILLSLRGVAPEIISGYEKKLSLKKINETLDSQVPPLIAAVEAWNR
jgi:hypothetical protein